MESFGIMDPVDALRLGAGVVLTLSLVFLLYIYGGYLWVLRSLVWLRKGAATSVSDQLRSTASGLDDTTLPGVTVYFSALNEEENVKQRIENLLAQDYPPDRLEIIVVSDGSRDRTAEFVRESIEEHGTCDIKLIEFEQNRGRAAAQNRVAKVATHEILIATDAETEFTPGLLRSVAAPFENPKVGVVGVRMVYRTAVSEIADSIVVYRSVEWTIRLLETELSVMCKTDGPCTAYRRSVWEDIEDFEDVDQVVVLFARKQGKHAVHLNDVYCIDSPNTEWRQEFRARSRMTRKGLLAIMNRWRFSDILADPSFSMALYSHKVVRYCSPLLLLCLFASTGVLALSSATIAGALATSLGVMVVLLGVGALLFPSRTAWALGRGKSFMLANAGFLWGIVGWITGNRAGTYKPTRQNR